MNLEIAPCVNSLLLEENGLSGSIPTEIALMTNLKRLSLSSNNFEGSFPTVTSRLEHLELGENELSGQIPSTVGLLGELEVSNYYQNYVSCVLFLTFVIIAVFWLASLADSHP